MTDSPRTYRFISLIIFISIIIGGTTINFLLRKNLQPIFDETLVILNLKKEVASAGIKSPQEYYEHKWHDIWYEPAQGVAPDRPLQKVFYRPLQVLTVSFKTLMWQIFQEKPAVPIFINSFFLSLAAAFIYLLGFKLTRDHFASAGGAFLMLCSMPAITGTWVILSGEHALVPLLICLQILSYCFWKERKSWPWLVAVFVLAFLGPLYKEYTAVGLFVICFAEITSTPRNWRMLALAVPFLIHSFFPALLINSIFFGHPAFSSTYIKMNVLPVALFGLFHFEAVNHLFFVLPPTILLLGILGIMISDQRHKFGIILLLCFIALFIPPESPLYGWARYSALLLLIWISVAMIRIDRLLAIWFFFSWLPYLLIFFNTIHLMYAVGPLAIGLLWYIRRLMARSPVLRIVIIAFLFMAFTDQALNLVSSYRVFKATNESAMSVAKVIAQDAPADKTIVLISNTLLGDDIEFFLAKNDRRYLKVNGYTFHDAVEWPRVYEDESRFRDVVSTEKGQSSIYFLDTDIFPTTLASFLSRLDNRPKLVYHQESNVFSPYADMLKFFIPAAYVSYPGSPDQKDYVLTETHWLHRRIYSKQRLLKWEE